MSDEVIHLFIQAPLVGIFVWFVLKYQKTFQDYLTERNGRSEKAQQRVAEALDDVARQLRDGQQLLARIHERVEK